MFFGLFYESKLLDIEDITDTKCLGEDPRKLGTFRIENREEKLENSSDRPWRTAPIRAPKERLCPAGSGTPR